MRSSTMNNDSNSRKEFKEQTLRRIYDALNPAAKTKITSRSTTEVTVKGLNPKKGKEE